MSARQVDPLWIEDEILKFDPSDDYHGNHAGEESLDAKSYYAALDRVARLLRGEIRDWTSVR